MLQKNQPLKKTTGFTLIELLIVIAVLGVLAAVLLIAIDPSDQFEKGRDAGRKSSVTQLGNALERFVTAQTKYPCQNSGWITALRDAGEIKIIPNNPTSDPGCWVGEGIEGNFCYQAFNTPCATAPQTKAFVHVNMESKSEKAKCPGATTVYYVWWSEAGRAGVSCSEPHLWGVDLAD